MKKSMTAAIVALLWLQAAAAPAGAAPKSMSVQVKSVQLKESPSFTAKGVGVAAYGDRVNVLEERGAWSRISAAGGAAGWVHSSALTSKRIEMKAGGGGMALGASTDEVATAGKGFNAQVEAEFKKKNADIDFTWVDRMEKIQVSPEQVRAFLIEGRVGTGGAQ